MNGLLLLLGAGHTGSAPAAIPYALLSGGLNSSNNTLVTSLLYSLSSNAVTSGASLTQGNRAESGTAGNTSVALISGGFTSGSSSTAATDVYTISAATMAGGTSLGTARAQLSGAGTTTVGIFVDGYVIAGATFPNVTDVYTYSGSTVTSGTTISATGRLRASMGNLGAAYFNGGYNSSNAVVAATYTYQYGAATTGTGTSITTAVGGGAGIGNQNVGIFAGGFTNNGATTFTVASYIYTYLAATVASGTNLGLARSNAATGGNTTLGLFAGGTTGSSSAYTDTYNFSSNTVTAGTALTYVASAPNGNSTVPGWFIYNGGSGSGYFGGGTVPGNAPSSAIYTLSFATWISATYSASLKTATSVCGCGGNSTTAVWFGGYNNSTGAINTTTYLVYSTQVTTSGPNTPSGAIYYLSNGQVGNSTVACFIGGNVGTIVMGGYQYVYSSNTVNTGSALSTGTAALAGISNATVGVVAGGYTSSTSSPTAATRNYTISTNSTVAGTNSLGQAREWAGGVSTSTGGIIGGGSTNGSNGSSYTDQIVFSSGTITTGTALLVAVQTPGVAGNPTNGVFWGGYNGSAAVVYSSVYNFTANTVSGGTYQSTALNAVGGTSSAPGGGYT
jgi:hypothetical protein